MSEFSDRFKATEGEFAADIELDRFYANGVAALRMKLPAGVTAMKHYHHYDHLLIVASGAIIVHRSDGVSSRAKQGDIITVPMKVEHALQAEVDSVTICIHATAFGDVEVMKAMEGAT